MLDLVEDAEEQMPDYSLLAAFQERRRESTDLRLVVQSILEHLDRVLDKERDVRGLHSLDGPETTPQQIPHVHLERNRVGVDCRLGELELAVDGRLEVCVRPQVPLENLPVPRVAQAKIDLSFLEHEPCHHVRATVPERRRHGLGGRRSRVHQRCSPDVLQ
eukprot:Amastigsp_a844695_30.p3 type:complete len:161 gc:universal Amastigsp_a844695_30:358-840(+)